MRNSFVAALLVLGQLGLGAGESGWDPVAGPSGSWVYVVVRSLSDVAPRIESAAAAFGPEAVEGAKAMPAEITQLFARQLGIEEDAVDAGKPFGFAVFNPTMGDNSVVAFVPVKAGGTLPENVKLVNGYAIAADNEQAAARVRGAFESAGAGAIQAPAGLARLHCDLGTIVQIFGPFVQMQASMALSQAPGGNAQAAAAAIDLIFSVLGQIQNFTIEADLTKDVVNATVDVLAKEGTDLAQLCANQGGGTALAGLVGSGDMTASGKVRGAAAWTRRLADQVIGKMLTDPKEADLARASVGKFLGNMGDEFAIAYRFAPNGMQGDGAAAFKGTMDDVREYFRFFTSDKAPKAFKDALSAGGAEVAYKVEEGARTVAGVTVDRVTTTMGGDAEVTDMVKKVWGGSAMSVEYALVNGTVVMVTGGADAAGRLDAVIAKAKNPLLGNAGADPVSFSMDLMALAGWGMQLSGMEAPPEALKGGAPITGTATFSGRTVTNRLAIPLATVAKLGAIVEQPMAPPPMAPVESTVEDVEEEEK